LLQLTSKTIRLTPNKCSTDSSLAHSSISISEIPCNATINKLTAFMR